MLTNAAVTTIPGYSPFPLSRQDTPYLQVPGPQGLVEGAQGGQQLAYTPTQEFFGSGFEGTAPPSSVPHAGDIWSVYGGSGGAPTSLAHEGVDPYANPAAAPAMTGQTVGGPMSVPNVIAALGNGPPRRA
jgi:hypothetical protein